jgi:DNA-binding transcriptional ArsR family regulator
VSNHLARLRTLGIVKCRKMCRDVHYWIDREMAADIVRGLEDALRLESPPVSPAEVDSP